MLIKATITLILSSLGIVYVEPQAFQVVPTDTCVPCGGSTEFNCTTTIPINLGEGRIVEGVGGQMWRIQAPDGTVTNLRSNIPDMVPADYEFIAPHNINDFTGLRVLNTSSTWNGTTLQCIAFDPSNVTRQNNSAAAVTLEVGGPPQFFTCELQCPDTYRSGISDRCTIMWERLPTVSCNSLQVSILLRQSDGTLVYSDVFSPNVTSTETAPLNQNTVYTVTITAENLCGTANCTATNSTAVEAPAAFNVTARVVFPSLTLEHINVTWTPPGPGNPLVDSYTVNFSSTDGQLCRSQTTGGNATSVVLDVTDCVICQSTNKSYAITVEASNRGGQATATTSLTTSLFQGYQVRDISAGGQCALNISCTVSDRTVVTGCVFMYDSNGNGTLDSETLLSLPLMDNTAEGRIIIDCNLNQLNFTIRAVAGTTLSTAVPVDCPVSGHSFNLVSSRVCPALLDPQNGHVEYSNQQRENGTIATYSCNEVFTLYGNIQRMCQRNAVWSGSAPTCTIVWWIVFLPVMILYMMMVLMGIVLLVCSGDNENVTRCSLVTLIALDFLPVAGIVIIIAVVIYQHHLKTKKVSLSSVVSESGGVELKEAENPPLVEHPRAGDDCTKPDKVLVYTELGSSGSGKASSIVPEESGAKV